MMTRVLLTLVLLCIPVGYVLGVVFVPAFIGMLFLGAGAFVIVWLTWSMAGYFLGID